VYLGKESTHATGTVTFTHVTAAGLITWIQNIGYNLYINIFFILLTHLTIYILRP